MRSTAGILVALLFTPPAIAQTSFDERNRYHSPAELRSELDEAAIQVRRAAGSGWVRQAIVTLDALTRVGDPTEVCTRARRIAAAAYEGIEATLRVGPLTRLEASIDARIIANYARSACARVGTPAPGDAQAVDRSVQAFQEQTEELRTLTDDILEQANRRFPNAEALPPDLARTLRSQATVALTRAAADALPDRYEQLAGFPRVGSVHLQTGGSRLEVSVRRDVAHVAYDPPLARDLSAAARTLALVDRDPRRMWDSLPAAAFHAGLSGDAGQVAADLADLTGLPSSGPEYADPEIDVRCRVAVYAAAAALADDSIPTVAPTPPCRSDPNAFADALMAVTFGRRIAAGDLHRNVSPDANLLVYGAELGPETAAATLASLVNAIVALNRLPDAVASFRALQAHTGGGAAEAVRLAALEHWSRRRGQAAAFTAYRNARDSLDVGVDVPLDEIPPPPMMTPDWVRDQEAARAANAPDRTVGGAAPQFVSRDVFRARQRSFSEAGQRLRAAVPEAAGILSDAPVPLDEARRYLRADEMLLVVRSDAYGTRSVAVTADGASQTASTWDDLVIGQMTHRLRWELGAEAVGQETGQRWLAETQDGRAFSRGLAHRLLGQLLADPPAALRGKRRLIVVADGPLASFPFSTLVVEPPGGEDHDPEALRRTAWLGDRVAVSQLPTVQSFVLLRQRAALDADANAAGATRATAFVGFGNPLTLGEELACRLDPGAVRGASARLRTMGEVDYRNPADLIRALPRIPCTETELRAVQAALGDSGRSQIVTGEAATERAFRNIDAANLDLLILATHGLLPAPNAGLNEAALVLTPPDEDAPAQDNDGFLLESEIPTLGISANWVILSACNSGSAAGSNELLGGLAHAFMLGGARALLVSYWPVRDDAAALLVSRAVATARAGGDRAEALQAAMREVRNDRTQDDVGRTLAHPIAWASFSMIGD
jgi:CHAT domain-containing protein